MGAVSDAISASAQARGATLRLGAPVRRVVIEGERAAQTWSVLDRARDKTPAKLSDAERSRVFLSGDESDGLRWGQRCLATKLWGIWYCVLVDSTREKKKEALAKLLPAKVGFVPVLKEVRKQGLAVR